MTYKELCEAKGDIITQQEILQARLADVNRQLIEILNRKPAIPDGKKEEAQKPIA